MCTCCASRINRRTSRFYAIEKRTNNPTHTVECTTSQSFNGRAFRGTRFQNGPGKRLGKLVRDGNHGQEKKIEHESPFFDRHCERHGRSFTGAFVLRRLKQDTHGLFFCFGLCLLKRLNIVALPKLCQVGIWIFLILFLHCIYSHYSI